MTKTHTFARTLHDVGLATWFGGSLMGAVGVNGAAAQVDQPGQRARVANAGWARWTPVNLAAIGAHLVGGLLLTRSNKGRIGAQKGVGKLTVVKGALTVGALGATAYARVLGQRVMDAGDVPMEGGTTPADDTPPEVEKAQRQLDTLQWAIPAMTGGLLVLNARMGEQQRPREVIAGVLKRFTPDALEGISANGKKARKRARKAAEKADRRARKLAARAGERAGELAATAREKAVDVAGTVRERAGGAAGTVKGKAVEVAGKVRERAGELAEKAA